jgi:K+-transporting ATPase ATPase A chain
LYIYCLFAVFSSFLGCLFFSAKRFDHHECIFNYWWDTVHTAFRLPRFRASFSGKIVMTLNSIVQLMFYLLLLLGLAVPLGAYMARVFSREARWAQRFLGPLERLIYRLCRIHAEEEMTWKKYAAAVLIFNLAGILVLYTWQRLQSLLPLNPAQLGAVPPDISFNTAISFATNTNWQAYSGESTLSYLTQMLGLTVQNFVSAATGMAVMAAFIRGFARRTSQYLE